jgi:hypothetical protein
MLNLPLAGIKTFVQNSTQMSSNRNPNGSFPSVPESLAAHDPGMRDYYHEAQKQQEFYPASTNPYLTPYLGLRARLSQIWINRWTVLLILVLIRALLAVRGLNDDLASAKTEALSACTGVENMGSAMASLPHYMSQGVNEIAADGIEKAVNGLYSVLNLSITALENIVLFIINLLTSTYVCLITLAVSSSLTTVISATEDITKFLNSTLSDVANGIQSDVSSAQSEINDIIDKAGSLFGIDSPTLDVDTSGLDNIALPQSIQDGLNTLNSSIPTFAQVQNFTNTALSIPFELLKVSHTLSYKTALLLTPPDIRQE